MRHLLDDERPSGAQEVRTTYRPERVAVPVHSGSSEDLIAAIEYECQLWGGATSPMIPLRADGSIRSEYRRILPGSAVDHVLGMHPFEMFDLEGASTPVATTDHGYARQLACALLEYHSQGDYRPLEVVTLATDDPWRGIYAACLGLLPDRPASDVLKQGRLKPDLTFEDFLRVSRTAETGSLQDLLARLESNENLTPRQASKIDLPQPEPWSVTSWAGDGVLPQRWATARAAGAAVVVACAPESVEDLALLWNLRAAHGDFYALPIGIPLAELSLESVERVRGASGLPRYGTRAKDIYVTSASLSIAEIAAALGDPLPTHIHLSAVGDLLTFGKAPGWSRDDVAVWQGGAASIIPVPPQADRDVFKDRGLNGMTRMHLDVELSEPRLPAVTDVRIDAPNATIYAGAQSTWKSADLRNQIVEIEWPSRFLIARALAGARGFAIRESEPGRASRVAIEALGDIGYIRNLAHAPLLKLLEEMAARQGFGWYKERLRHALSGDAPPPEVGPSTEELPERSYGDFKKALGNNERATKFWLLWAESANLVVKGFQIICSECGAKQWIPIAAFPPPITCRGCATTIAAPFGDRPTANFRYKISERLRRVYEQDAMGHLLLVRFLDALFYDSQGRHTVGLHPGIEIVSEAGDSALGEADVLLLTSQGDFVSAEVKRTASGLTDSEVQKHDHLTELLGSPWSILAVSQYEKDAGDRLGELRQEYPGGAHKRLVLSYDSLLTPFPFWAYGDDPFDAPPMSDEGIAEREVEFVRHLAQLSENASFDWLAESMMTRPRPRRTRDD